MKNIPDSVQFIKRQVMVVTGVLRLLIILLFLIKISYVTATDSEEETQTESNDKSQVDTTKTCDQLKISRVPGDEPSECVDCYSACVLRKEEICDEEKKPIDYQRMWCKMTCGFCAATPPTDECPLRKVNLKDRTNNHGYPNIKSWQDCAIMCGEKDNCNAWTWKNCNDKHYKYECVLMEAFGYKEEDPNMISGMKNCVGQEDADNENIEEFCEDNKEDTAVEDGVWGEWGVWTKCTAYCEGGTNNRSRECDGPFNGGKPCEGIHLEEQKCNVTPCRDAFIKKIHGNTVAFIKGALSKYTFPSMICDVSRFKDESIAHSHCAVQCSKNASCTSIGL